MKYLHENLSMYHNIYKYYTYTTSSHLPSSIVKHSAQQLDGCLALADSFQMDARVRLAVILSTDKVFCNLGTFDFAASHLSSAGGSHLSAVAEILYLIERLEKLHTEVQGMVSSPHLDTTLPYNV